MARRSGNSMVTSGSTNTSFTRKENQRLIALGRVLTKSDRIMTGIPTLEVQFLDAFPYPAGTDGKKITIKADANIQQGKKWMVNVVGLNWHEVAHIYFSRKMGDGTNYREQIKNHMVTAAYQILEDARIETQFVAMYRPVRHYFAQAVIVNLLDSRKWGASTQVRMNRAATLWPFLHGRKYLPLSLRESYKAIYKDQQNVDRMAEIIDEYRLLDLNDRLDRGSGIALCREFQALMTQEQQDESDEQCGDDSQGSEGASGSESKSAAQKAKKEAEEQEEKEEEGEDGSGFYEEDEEDEEEGESDDDGDGADGDSGDSDEEEGDSEDEEASSGGGGDSDSEDDDSEDGESDAEVDSDEDGDSDDEGDSDSGNGGDSDVDEDDGEEDEDSESDSDEDGVGGGGKVTLSDIEDELEDALQEIAYNSDVQEEVQRINEAVNDPRNIDMDMSGAKDERRSYPVPSHLKSTVMEVTEQFKRLYAEMEPGWHYGSDNGRLNVDRAIQSEDPEYIFDEWDEGKEQESGIEVCIMLDCSSSMDGTAMREAAHATWVIKRAVEQVDGTVSVIGFHFSSFPLIGRNEKASPDEYELPIDLGGNTVPWDGIDIAKWVLEISDQPNKIFVLITDGFFYNVPGQMVPDYIKKFQTVDATRVYIGISDDGRDLGGQYKDGFDTSLTVASATQIVPVVQQTITTILTNLAHR